MLGTELNHYKLLRELGRGGMGAVYAAEDQKLKRQVALKVLPPELAEDDDRLRRFQREARAVAALNHPNIVVLHSVEESGDTHFITMELVEGRPLADVIPAGGLPLDKLFDYGIALADAVSAAHENGITHRDLKPTNVMVTREDRIKVLDFGLAKLAEPESGDDQATQLETASLTGDGKVLGTVAHMSPEQAEGKSVDHRADIFALGILLYEMAAGQRPFRGDSTLSVLSSVIKDTPAPVTEIKPGLPRHLARILARCLEKNPEHRYQSAKDLRNELAGLKQEIESAQMEAPPPPERTSARPLGRILALIAAGLGLVAVVGYVLRDDVAPPPAPPPQLLSIATADSTSGTYYPIGRAMASLLEREIPGVAVQVMATEGSFQNASLLDRGEVSLALMQSDVAFHSVKTDRVLGHRSDAIVGLLAVNQEFAHILVRRDAGVSALGDLPGHIVSLNLPDSGSRFTSDMLLDHFGVELAESDTVFLSTSEANIALVDGSLDVSMQWIAAPHSDLLGVMRSDRVALLPIDPELARGLQASQPFLIPGKIAAGTYPNQVEAVDTVVVKALLVGHASLPESFVTAMLDAVFANVPDLIAAHPRAAEISIDRAFRLEDGISIPLHPAAERYRREHGE